MPLFSLDELYSDNNMQAKTRAMFVQCNPDGPLSVLRKDVPHKINLYKIYMDLCVDDPSETKFAETVFGDIVYWKNQMSQDKWFSKYLEEWRMAATEKRKSLAFEAIMNEVKDKGKSGFTAAKYLIEEPWLVGATATEKKEIAKTRRLTSERAYSATAFQEDLARLKEEGVLN